MMEPPMRPMIKGIIQPKPYVESGVAATMALAKPRLDQTGQGFEECV
jgi:hypothetical protein